MNQTAASFESRSSEAVPAVFAFSEDPFVGIFSLLSEDESKEIRIACTRLVSLFAGRYPVIRKKCIQQLIDMLNDEHDEVRLKAIDGIFDIKEEQLLLSKEEVSTVVFNLKEDNALLRKGIYRLFSKVEVREEESF